MKSLNVLLTKALDEECRQQIVNVSPGIKLTDASDLYRSEESGDLSAKERLDSLLAETEVLLVHSPPSNIIRRAPKLRWIQTAMTGVDRFLDTEITESPVLLTNCRGIHAVPLAEFALGLMLMFAKQSPLCFQLKQEKRWKRYPPVPVLLRGKTVGIVGLGSIGQETARLAKAFGMRVLATRRTAKQTGRTRYVDLLLPKGQLRQLLTESDFVVLTVPHTHETDKMIGEAELRAMKPTAYLINIANGGILDEVALSHALEEHRIAGAGLDVYATEPLPVESKLWELPNTILSFVFAGGLRDAPKPPTDVFCENLRRYLSGEKLLNVVNKRRGY